MKQSSKLKLILTATVLSSYGLWTVNHSSPITALGMTIVIVSSAGANYILSKKQLAIRYCEVLSYFMINHKYLLGRINIYNGYNWRQKLARAPPLL